MRRTALALLIPLFVTTSGLGLAQDGGKPQKATIIKAGRLIDVRAGRVRNDRTVHLAEAVFRCLTRAG
jgi:hypothetical protein